MAGSGSASVVHAVNGPLAFGGDSVDPLLALAALALRVLVLVQPRGDEAQLLQLVQLAVDLAERRRPVEELQTPVGPALHVEAGQFLTERQQPQHRVARRAQSRLRLRVVVGHGDTLEQRAGDARNTARPRLYF